MTAPTPTPTPAPSPMYERIKALYFSGRLDDAGLDLAVAPPKKWITAAEAAAIRAAKLQQAAENDIIDGLVLDALAKDA